MAGRPKVSLRKMPGTPEFMEEYRAAVVAAETAPRQARVMARG